MSAAKRRGGQSLHLDLSDGHLESTPPVAALFLVTFDVKAGYTVAWQRSVQDLKLSQSVEYRSFPSGLHNVQEDLIYFTHGDEYAGISAYINKPSQDAERHSLMIAVGVLLPSHGQLGKAWLHTEALKDLARSLSHDKRNTQPLQDYWEAHQLHDSDGVSDSAADFPSTAKAKQVEPQSFSNGTTHKRSRAVSTASALAPSSQKLSSYHPAHALRTFLETFGPLCFPVYKIALLRRRILLATHAPVELACKFVYNSSLISGIPSSVADVIPLEPLPFRLASLYSVGLHEMDILSHGGRKLEGFEEEGFGWIACTTDDILSQKTHLYDYLIKLPPPHTKRAEQRVWPRIYDSKGSELKATQRDLRRYRVLKREIHRFDLLPSPNATTPDFPRSLTTLNQDSYETDTSSTHDADLAEKKSFTAVVYEGFMWWAAAGEKRTDLDEEEQQDAALLRQVDGEGSPNRPRSSGRSPAGMHLSDHGPAALEVAIVAFFHRLTTQILKTLADLVTDADNASILDEGAAGDNGSLATGSFDSAPLISAEDSEKRCPVVVEADEMSRMGLDLWSDSDRTFVEELVALYWGRKAEVAKTPAIECCGVKIC